MSEDSDWFVPKRYGFGAMPVTWQGWALTIGFILILIGDRLLFGHKPIAFFAVLIPVMVTFIVITAHTTRGGLRWRWGEKD